MPPTDGRDVSNDYDPSAHGDSGPVLVSLPNSATPFHQKIIQVAHETDDDKFRFNKDINAGSLLGIGWLTAAHGGGVRSASTSYLSGEVLERANLHILTGAHVTKILFKNEGEVPVAVGVEFVESSNGEELDTFGLTTFHQRILYF